MKFVKASVCLSIVLAISACSEQGSVESHLKNAKNYINQSKTNESIIELKNAIRADNKNAEARFLLGQAYLSLGNGAAAVKELERAYQYQYAINKVLPLLARAYILTDSDIEVLALSEAATQLANEEYAHYLAYKTLAALRSGKIEQAQESTSLAESLAKKSLYTMLAQAYLALSENHYEKANALISRILLINEKELDTLMLQGQVSMATKEYKQAAQSFEQYLKLQPQVGVAQLLLADALLKSGQYDDAEKYANNILAQVESQPFAHYIKAMVAFHREAFDKASEHAELALSKTFSPFDLKLVAGASAFYLKNWQGSHRHLSTIVKYLPKDHQVRRMLALTQLELGLIDEISATLDGFEDDDTQFLSAMSYRLLELGATDEAKKILEKNKDVVSNPEDKARQGVLKLMMNDLSGIQNLEEAIALQPDLVEAELALAFAALQNNDIAKAREIAIQWLQKHPKKPEGYNLMAGIAIKERNYDKAEKSLAKSLTVAPDNIFALTEQLRIARLQKNDELSQERVDYLIIQAPDNSKVLRAYFGFYQNEMALVKLQEAYQKDTADLGKALLVAEAMMTLEQHKEAEDLLSSLEGTPKLPKRYWQLIISNYQRSYKENKENKSNKVQQVLENWSKVSPYHIEPIGLLADLHASRGDNKRALSVVNRGLEYHQDNVVLQLIKMQLLLKSQKVIEAKTLYKVLNDSDINAALKQGMLGRILLLEEKYEAAIPKISNLYTAYPSSQNAAHLANAYIGNNNEPKAIEVLEHYLTLNENDSRIKTILAGIYIKGDSNKAIASYEDVVKKQPKNVIAHNNLAWLYLEQGKTEQALEHAKAAFELAPQIANVADTYGKVLLVSGDKRAALEYTTKASEISKGKDIDIQLNYVNALIANSRKNEAKNALEKIVTKTDEQAKLKLKLQSQL